MEVGEVAHGKKEDEARQEARGEGEDHGISDEGRRKDVDPPEPAVAHD